ncbi:MAG: DUF1844 domain-containing protein [Candidatus Korobacteraceae bacterium]
MPDKEKKPEFVVTDRRLFSTDGELRQDVVEDEERRAEREREKTEAQRLANEERAAQQHPAPSSATQTKSIVTDEATPDGPTAEEQHDSAAAYRESTREIDDRIEREMRKQGQPHRAQDFEITFEKFVASLYMSALMQLGLAAPQGGKPEVDLLGARQTIDTLAILQEKTKGNLTPAEQSMLQNCLYELRMAYLEVTNLLTHPPQGGPAVDGKV